MGQKLFECLESVDTPRSRQRVTDYLNSQPFPHYEQHAELPGLLAVKPMMLALLILSSSL